MTKEEIEQIEKELEEIEWPPFIEGDSNGVDLTIEGDIILIDFYSGDEKIAKKAIKYGWFLAKAPERIDALIKEVKMLEKELNDCKDAFVSQMGV